MKHSQLILLFLCVSGSAVAMTYDDIKQKINTFYGLIDVNNSIVAKLSQSVKNFNYLEHIRDYNDHIKNKYIELFKNTQIKVLACENNLQLSLEIGKLNERNTFLLLHNFLNFLYKKIVYQDNNVEQYKNLRATELFDDLIALRLECAKFLTQNSELRKSILDFSPLALSRWNPFGWGNWYDRLHRTVSSLPSMPWDENDGKNSKRVLVEDHVRTIQNNMNNYGDDIKPIAQLYVCIMRELRFIIKTNLSTIGRNTLRYTAGALGIMASIPLIKYFFGGTKSGKKGELPELNDNLK